MFKLKFTHKEKELAFLMCNIAVSLTFITHFVGSFDSSFSQRRRLMIAFGTIISLLLNNLALILTAWKFHFDSLMVSSLCFVLSIFYWFSYKVTATWWELTMHCLLLNFMTCLAGLTNLFVYLSWKAAKEKQSK